jgi:GNAT superfamily N-acetyltransferase
MKIRGMSGALLRKYNPEKDYLAVQAVLEQAELYDEDRDTDERLRKHAGSVIVAELNREIVGCVYVVDHIVPTINRLVVAEEHRRQGIGTDLFHAAVELLYRQGAKDVELFFEAADKSLEEWYQKLGMKNGGNYTSMWRYTKYDKPRM